MLWFRREPNGGFTALWNGEETGYRLIRRNREIREMGHNYGLVVPHNSHVLPVTNLAQGKAAIREFIEEEIADGKRSV